MPAEQICFISAVHGSMMSVGPRPACLGLQTLHGSHRQLSEESMSCCFFFLATSYRCRHASAEVSMISALKTRAPHPPQACLLAKAMNLVPPSEYCLQSMTSWRHRGRRGLRRWRSSLTAAHSPSGCRRCSNWARLCKCTPVAPASTTLTQTVPVKRMFCPATTSLWPLRTRRSAFCKQNEKKEKKSDPLQPGIIYTVGIRALTCHLLYPCTGAWVGSLAGGTRLL